MGLFTLAVISENSLSNQGEVLCISDKHLSASEGVGQGTLVRTQCSQTCTLLHMVFLMTATRPSSLSLLFSENNVLILCTTYYTVPQTFHIDITLAWRASQ